MSDQAEVARRLGGKDLAGHEQGPGRPRAHGLHDIGRDSAGYQAQLHFGKGEPGSLDRHGHVAGRHDPGPAAHGRALDDRHRQGRNVVERLEHPRQAHGVVAIVAFGPVGRIPHPGQIGAGAERPARPPNEHRPDLIRTVQGFEGLAQGRDGRGVEGVLLGGPVDRDEHRAVRRGLDADQPAIRVRRRVGDQGMGDSVDLRRIGVGDVQGFGIGVGHAGLLGLTAYNA